MPVLLAGLCLGLTLPGFAGGVVANCTEADLRGALAGGGVVTFGCEGTIALGHTVCITNDTWLDASGRAVVISGNNAVRVFMVNTGVTFTVVNLAIVDGRTNAGAGIFNAGGLLELVSVRFTNNQAVANDPLGGYSGVAQGGAIFNARGVVNATNCVFDHSQAISSPPDIAAGGAIHNEGGAVNLVGTILSSNRCVGGDGVPYALEYGRRTGCASSGGGVFNVAWR